MSAPPQRPPRGIKKKKPEQLDQQQEVADIPIADIPQTDEDIQSPFNESGVQTAIPSTVQTLENRTNGKKRGFLARAMTLFSKNVNQKQDSRVGQGSTDFQNWNSVGKDCRKPVPSNKPMIKEQLKYLKSLGIQFDNYLGTDTYGHVWKVSVKRRNTGQKDVLSCKVLSMNTFDTNKQRMTTVGEAVENMFHEIRILRDLVHPNIIRLVDEIQVPDSKTGFPYSCVCMLMESTDGTLSHLIQRPLARLLLEDECNEWFGQICEAIHFLHHKSIVHLNIKPESIQFVIKRDKLFKLCDFCYAVDFGEGMSTISKRIHVPILADKCMAPEISSGWSPLNGYDTKSVDIWDLCVTLIRALIGVHIDPQMMLKDLRAGNWMSIQYMPHPPTDLLVDLLNRMTEDYPNDRLTIDQVCAHDWVNILESTDL